MAIPDVNKLKDGRFFLFSLSLFLSLSPFLLPSFLLFSAYQINNLKNKTKKQAVVTAHLKVAGDGPLLNVGLAPGQGSLSPI